MRKIGMLVVVLFLSGCALTSWTKLKGREYKDGARDFAAVVPEGWMRFNLAKYFVMTRDGTVLDRVIVDRVRFKAKLEFTKKVYSADMTPQDLSEVEIDNLKANGQIGKVEITGNKPAAVAGEDCYRLEYTYVVTAGGLKIRGIEYGFKYKDWVYRVVYDAADQHYFNANVESFNRFVESFRLL